MRIIKFTAWGSVTFGEVEGGGGSEKASGGGGAWGGVWGG